MVPLERDPAQTTSVGSQIAEYVAAVETTEDGFWRVRCGCGFTVKLGTVEAAEDTRRWHMGEPSQIEDQCGLRGRHHG